MIWAAIEGANIDWAGDGPWLAVLLILVSGVAIPVILYALFDRWAARRLRVDTIALATRFGGFMNSWAVFGRHASEYRDLKPLFPGAQAAELARFPDGTATIAARFRSPSAAAAAAEQRFASFASAGVEYADAGIAFRTPDTDRPGTYARGQWLVIGDTLFAFYAPSSAALIRRRQATPALRARRFPGPLRLLHSRVGHCIALTLWLAMHVMTASFMLDRAAWRTGQGRPVAESELRERLSSMQIYRNGFRPQRIKGPNSLMIARPADDPRHEDLDRLAGRSGVTGIQLVFDAQRNVVHALLLVGRTGEAQAGTSSAVLERWRNNPLLLESGDPLVVAIRQTVQDAGWDWRPRSWPLPPDWLQAADDFCCSVRRPVSIPDRPS